MKEPTQHARTYANPFFRSNFWFISVFWCVHTGAAIGAAEDGSQSQRPVNTCLGSEDALKSAEILEQVRMSMPIRSNVTNRE